MSLSQEQVARYAQKILEEHGIEEPPIPVEELARLVGAEVQRRPNGPDISGLLYRDDSNPDVVVIGVNLDEAPVRQRFTIAHELGHLLMHPGRQLWVDRSVRVNLREVGEHGRGGEEREANWFAADLLMPEHMVRTTAARLAQRRQVTEDSLVLALADTFQVSRQAMGYRLLNLGLVSSV
jgi:Zn-dependent peptidase ImmA (M78 family)